MIKERYTISNVVAVHVEAALYNVWNGGVRIGYIEKDYWGKTWRFTLFDHKKNVEKLVTFEQYNTVRKITQQVIDDETTE